MLPSLTSDALLTGGASLCCLPPHTLQSVRVSPEQALRSMDVAGPGFHARANDTATVLRTPGCTFCFPGAFHRFDEIFLATSDSIMPLSGGLTVGGVIFDNSLFNSSVFFSIQTDLARLVVPPDDPETLSLFVHFDATGSYTVTERATSQVVSSGPLTGQGIAEAILRRGQIDPITGRQIYVTESVTYRFNNNPPVPEPATLTLFGLGSGGLWLLRRRKVKRRRACRSLDAERACRRGTPFSLTTV